MSHYTVPEFNTNHQKQLQSMCAVPPFLDDEKDEFAYFPVDSIYTSGNGLPSLVVSTADQNHTLLTIKQDSDVIFTYWSLATLIHSNVKNNATKWVNSIVTSPLSLLQHAFETKSDVYPITGLNSLYLTLLCLEQGIGENIWVLDSSNDIKSVYLSSYIHTLNRDPKNIDLNTSVHPYFFLEPENKHNQHVYAGVRIKPFNRSYRSFCERLPFRPLGMKYTPSSWVNVLINKFSQFEVFRESTKIALKHPDLFAALIVCSVGLPSTMLYDNVDYCSMIDLSRYQICEMLVKLSPLIDHCTYLMSDVSQIRDNISYFYQERNPDIA